MSRQRKNEEDRQERKAELKIQDKTKGNQDKEMLLEVYSNLGGNRKKKKGRKEGGKWRV